jgi:large subunit ribosomal protein L3
MCAVEKNMSVKGLLGKKVGMTQIFDAEGKVVPVTVIAVEPNVVSQVRTLEKDGYSAAQLAYEDVRVTRLTRPEQGHLAAAGVQPKRFLREVEIQDGASVSVGQEFKADVFAEGERVSVIGTTKGKGFQGVVRRYGFHGQNKTHGSSLTQRKPQSSGATVAARVFKGTRKPGHMGDERMTQQGLRVVRIDTDKNLILVRGAVPGAADSLVMVQKTHRVYREPKQQEQKKTSNKK